MKKMPFHILLNKLISISSIKKTRLAEYLNYDISYLSKWISGKNLPSKKNINIISSMISEFICNNITSKDKEILIDYLDFDQEKSTISLSLRIENELMDSYYNTVKENVNSDYDNPRNNNNDGSIIVFPEHLNHFGLKKIKESLKQNNNLNIIVSCDFFAMNDKNAYYLFEKEIYDYISDANCRFNMRAILSYRYLYDDIVRNIETLYYIIVSLPFDLFQIYMTKDMICNDVFILKDYIAVISGYFNSSRYLFTTAVNRLEDVQELYNVNDKLISNNCSIICKPYNDNIFTIFRILISGSKFKFIISNINELFLPKDLFKKIASSVFEPDQADLLCNLHDKMDTILKNEHVKLIMYRKEEIDYLSSGKLHFFNKKVNVELEDRLRHLNNLSSIMQINDKLDVKSCLSDYLSNSPIDNGISFYISDHTVIAKSLESKEDLCFSICDNEIKKATSDFFDALWNDESYIVRHDKGSILV